MRKFNVNKSHRTTLYGRKLPVGAVYGEYKGLIYLVTDFCPIWNCVNPEASKSRQVYVPNYNISILNTNTGHWYKSQTTRSKRLMELANFLTRMFEDLDIRHNTEVTYHISKNDVAKVAPKERKVQTEYTYKALGKPVTITDEYDGLPHQDAIPHWDLGNERKSYNIYPHKHKFNKPAPDIMTNIRRGKTSGMNIRNRIESVAHSDNSMFYKTVKMSEERK